MFKKRTCRHDNLRGIYGDEIMARGMKRSECLDCHRLFDSLPPDWSRPFFTRDHNGNVFSISHGNVPTDTKGTPCTLVALDIRPVTRQDYDDALEYVASRLGQTEGPPPDTGESDPWSWLPWRKKAS